MAYLGKVAGNRHTGTSKDSFNGDGSTTAFTMSKTVLLVTDIEVFVDNVQQEPTTSYTVSATTLTFDEAPPSGTANVYVIHRSGNNDSFTIQSGTSPSFNNLTIKNDGNIGSAGDSDSIAINSSGRVTLSNNLTVNGTSTLTGNISGGNDLSLASDSAVLNLGADSDTSITHIADTGLRVNPGILFGASDTASANTLDDYEEGSFTITVTYDTTINNSPDNDSSATHSGTGRYTKIGNMVTAFYPTLATSFASNADILLGTYTLPFTASATQGTTAYTNGYTAHGYYSSNFGQALLYFQISAGASTGAWGALDTAGAGSGFVRREANATIDQFFISYYV